MKPEQLEAIRKRSSATSGNWLADYLKMKNAKIVLTDDVPALIAEVERLNTVIQDALSIAEMQQEDFALEPWASLLDAVNGCDA